MGSTLSKLSHTPAPRIPTDTASTDRAPTHQAHYTLQFCSSASPNSAPLLDECNRVFLADFGPGHRIDPPLPPELLVLVASEGSSSATAGVVTLHHYARTGAWELGTVSAAVPHTHGAIMRFLLAEAPAAIRAWHRSRGGVAPRAWLVKRVKRTNAALIATLRSMGFDPPAHFMASVLSDDGYVPFDPVDEMLMKRAVTL